MLASFWGFPDVVKSLLDGGVDVNQQNKGTLWTPLHAATFQEHGKVSVGVYHKDILLCNCMQLQ